MSEKERMIAAGYKSAVDMAMVWAYDREEARFWMGGMVALAKWAGAVGDDQLTADMNRVRAEIARRAQSELVHYG